MGDILLRSHGKIIHPVNRRKGCNKFNALDIYHCLDANFPKLDTHLLKRTGDPVCKRLPQQGAVKYSPLFAQAH